jgi:hypothetical protein
LGGERADSLDGGADNNTQTGSPGNDHQDASDGSDLFSFDTGHDRIHNFEPGLAAFPSGRFSTPRSTSRWRARRHPGDLK